MLYMHSQFCLFICHNFAINIQYDIPDSSFLIQKTIHSKHQWGHAKMQVLNIRRIRTFGIYENNIRQSQELHKVIYDPSNTAIYWH